MHSLGFAARDGVCANASFSQVKNLKQGTKIFDVFSSDLRRGIYRGDMSQVLRLFCSFWLCLKLILN